MGTCCPQHTPGTSRQPDTRSGLSRAQRRLLRCMPARFSTEAHCAFSPPIISMALSDCNVQYRFFDSVSTNVYRAIPASGEMGRGGHAELPALKVSTQEYQPEIRDDREDVQTRSVIHSVRLCGAWEASAFTHVVSVECPYRTHLPDHTIT